MKQLTSGVILLLAASIVSADEETPTGWFGKGEFGLVATSGNTDTTSINLGLEFIRELDKWRHRFAVDALKAEENDNDTADRRAAEWQSDYKLSDISHLLGVARHEADDFSGFDYQQSIALGYGRQLIDSEAHKLKGEIGPGVRRIKDAVTRETSTDGIVRGLLDYAWTVTDTTSFTNRFLVEAGSDNTFVENDAAVAVAINDRFALKFGVAVRHNTDAPAGTDETDTVTSANLVYNFK